MAAKRGVDVVGSGLGLVVLSPVFILVAVAIKLETRGPVFFRQLRVGADGRLFRVFKFRTMVADAEDRKQSVAHLNWHAGEGGDSRMFKIRDDPRATRVGRVLRRHFLDELPQLINVLRGEMSLVGPRPLIVDEDRHVRDWARGRLSFKPGMTGLWQVLGHSEIPFSAMVQLDIEYISTWSLKNDARLLLRTMPLVVRGDAP